MQREPTLSHSEIELTLNIQYNTEIFLSWELRLKNMVREQNQYAFAIVRKILQSLNKVSRTHSKANEKKPEHFHDLKKKKMQEKKTT